MKIKDEVEQRDRVKRRMIEKECREGSERERERERQRERKRRQREW